MEPAYNMPAPNPVESPPLAPTQVHSKVGAAALAGSVTVVAVWLAEVFGASVPVEPGIAIGTIVAFIAGYIAKS